MTRSSVRSKQTVSDMEETKSHIIAAGRELLMAAKGALFFCKEFAEQSVAANARPELLKFFGKAIAVADELGKGISSVTSIKRTAGSFAKPVLSAIGKEMAAEKKAWTQTCRRSRSKARKTRLVHKKKKRSK